ncbi:MAG: HIT family protein [Mucispirillum sp.]|nr:HIT family protein [Mucispirillum sp.]
MNENCIFCKIVKGEIPSSKVYEDDDILAFMDINPIARGHTLVIPKAHCRNALDTPAETGVKIYPAVTKIANAVKKAYNADGINIMQFNEPAAGQEVYHSHIHIIPRYENDQLGIVMPARVKAAMEEIFSDAEKIKGAL